MGDKKKGKLGIEPMVRVPEYRLLLRGLSDRGIKLEGLPPERIERKLAMCVKLGWLSERQRDVLAAALLSR